MTVFRRKEKERERESVGAGDKFFYVLRSTTYGPLRYLQCVRVCVCKSNIVRERERETRGESFLLCVKEHYHSNTQSRVHNIYNNNIAKIYNIHEELTAHTESQINEQQSTIVCGLTKKKRINSK